MTKRTFVLLAVLFLVAPILQAQEPVVGVKDPESLFSDKDPALNRNKQAALHIMRELLQCAQWDRAGEWLTDAYHQHNPNAASGLKGVVTFFKHVTAHVGWNEMRATTAADHMPSLPPRPGIVPGFSLQGPIPIEATAGNAWPEWPPKNTSSPR